MNKLVYAALVVGCVSAQDIPEKVKEVEFDGCQPKAHQCDKNKYADGCCALSEITKGEVPDEKAWKRYFEVQKKYGGACVPSYTLVFMDRNGGQGSVYDYYETLWTINPDHSYFFQNFGYCEENKDEKVFEKWSTCQGLDKNWRNTWFKTSCMEERVKGTEGAGDTEKKGEGFIECRGRSDQCKVGEKYEGGCCATGKIVKGSLSNQPKDIRDVFKKMEKGVTVCMPGNVADFFEDGQVKSIYEYNEFLWNTDEDFKRVMTKGMKDIPKDFNQFWEMAKAHSKEIGDWRDIYMDAYCVDKKISTRGRGGDYDHRRGRKGRKERGDKILVEMGGTKVTIRMDAMKFAAPVAATLGAMTLF